MTEREAIERLRDDAHERGMNDLVITYGWSLIRLAMEELNSQWEARS